MRLKLKTGISKIINLYRENISTSWRHPHLRKLEILLKGLWLSGYYRAKISWRAMHGWRQPLKPLPY